jgi:hypothetical protein
MRTTLPEEKERFEFVLKVGAVEARSKRENLQHPEKKRRERGKEGERSTDPVMLPMNFQLALP